MFLSYYFFPEPIIYSMGTRAESIFSSLGLGEEEVGVYNAVKQAFEEYSRTPLIRTPSESHWCGRIRGMVAREGFVYEQKRLSVTRNVVV